MNGAVPFTPDELRRIAERVSEILGDLGPEGGDLAPDDWRWGVRVKVYMPDIPQAVGVIAPHRDGWLGFYPNAIEPAL